MDTSRSASWISYDTFLRLERDWGRLCAEGWKGYIKKENAIGGIVGGIKLDERLVEIMDKNGSGTGSVSLHDVMRESFPAVGKWDVRRFFVTEIPDEQLLTLKGSFGQGTMMRYLPKDCKHFVTTFDALTRSTASRLSLQQLLAASEVIGNMRFTLDQFVEAACKCNVDPQRYRASFWEVLRVLFPRVPSQVIERYEALFIPSSDVCAFASCFNGSSHLDLNIVKQNLKNSNTRSLNLTNGISVDYRSFAQMDKSKDGKLSLYELVQSYYPNIPPPHVKKAIQRHNIVVKEEERFTAENQFKIQMRLPVLDFLNKKRNEPKARPLSVSSTDTASTMDSDVCASTHAAITAGEAPHKVFIEVQPKHLER